MNIFDRIFGKKKIRISGTVPSSFVDGEGMRFALFVQGCPHGCKGCHNPHTWDRSGGILLPIKQVANEIQQSFERHPFTDGITISGGEPFLQEEECLQLLKYFPSYMNVWVYTGYEYEDIKDRPLTKRADVLVTGPYVEELKCSGAYYGSSNQEIHKKLDSDMIGNEKFSHMI